MNLKEGLSLYRDLNREEYFEKNMELGSTLWENQKIPTVADIADFMNGEENENMNAIFDFFDNKDDFIKMATRTDNVYDQEESTAFIRKVMSANNEDISKAGYFYKLLMASADDIVIKDEICDSKGIKFKLEEITEDVFDYRIKSLFCEELGKFVINYYDQFIEECKSLNLDELTFRTPLECQYYKERKICKHCAGALPDNTFNIGSFTTLMVTENATQSALSSMNKGVKKNINDIIASGYPGGYDWEEIKEWIREIVTQLDNKNVSSRFYEISLLSRVRWDKDGPFVASLKGSINYSGNMLGSYIFTSNNRNFEKVINAGTFTDSSLKLQIAMNDLKRR